jgi:hydroxymethylbilane synthase
MSGLRIGTRGSVLALAQAEHVTALLSEQSGMEVEIVVVRVSGDIPSGNAGGLGIRDAGTSTGMVDGPGPAEGSGEDKRRWVDTIEDALLSGAIDLAVHSAKDVPGELAGGLTLLGAPARVAAEDVLCFAPGSHVGGGRNRGGDQHGGSTGPDSFAEGARIGTSSLRRAAQLRAAREDLQIIAMGGNVDTRLRLLADGRFDAIVLAGAGLQRLGREDAIGAVLDSARFVPAPGQGALALEARTEDSRVAEAAGAILDNDSSACLRAERALAHALNASCRTPLGAHARPAGCGCLQLRAWVGLPDGSAWVADELVGGFYDPVELGHRVAERMTVAGAADILQRAEEMAVVGG